MISAILIARASLTVKAVSVTDLEDYHHPKLDRIGRMNLAGRERLTVVSHGK